MLFQDIEKSIAYILIDFDNFMTGNLKEIESEALQSHFHKFILDTVKYETINEIVIRLYGAWYNNKFLTDKGSQLQQKIATLDIFPYIHGKKLIRGKIELATSLLALPRVVLYNTLIEREGISMVRVDREKYTSICESNSITCPGKILEKFTRKKTKVCSVENCSTIQNSIFKGVHQKMVDTLLASDLLFLCTEKNTGSIALVSDDADLFPPILQGLSAQKNVRINLYFKNSNVENIYHEIFLQFENTEIIIYDYA